MCRSCATENIITQYIFPEDPWDPAEDSIQLYTHTSVFSLQY